MHQIRSSSQRVTLDSTGFMARAQFAKATFQRPRTETKQIRRLLCKFARTTDAGCASTPCVMRSIGTRRASASRICRTICPRKPVQCAHRRHVG